MHVLIQAGAGINLEGARRSTPLMCAVSNGHVNCVQLLVDSGALLNVVDDLGCTALMKAAYACIPECVDTLLTAGALVNLTDNNGQTALIKAALGGDRACVTSLLSHNARVNIGDAAGSTALIKLVSKSWLPQTTPQRELLTQHYSIIRRLCGAGADVNATNSDNETLVMIAASIGFTECVEYLLGQDNTELCRLNDAGESAITLAAKYGHPGALQLLCDRDRHHLKNAVDQIGHTPIMHAALNDRHQCVSILARAAVDVNVINHSKTTPLMRMAQAGRADAVRDLIQAGAEVGRRNVDGRTAYDLSANSECRRLLRTD